MNVIVSSENLEGMFNGIGGNNAVWGKGAGTDTGKGMDNFMGSIGEMSQVAMANVGGLFLQNKVKRARAAEVRDEITTARASTDEPPFTIDQRDWLGEVVGDSIKDALTSFGMGYARRIEAAIEARFLAAEKKFEDLDVQGEKNAQNIVDLEQMVVDLRAELMKSVEAQKESTNVALHQKIETMASQINEQKSNIEAAQRSTTATAGRQAVAPGDPPYESRTRGLLMNLLPPLAHGTIIDDEQRRARTTQAYNKALEILQQLQIPPEYYKNMVSLWNAKGVELDCPSHGHLQIIRSKVSLANLSFGDSAPGVKSTVFFDACKTKGELRPGLLTHKAYDVIIDLEKGQDRPGKVLKDMRGKTVKVNDTRVGYSLQGVWAWSPFAVKRYNPAELEMATGFVNGY